MDSLDDLLKKRTAFDEAVTPILRKLQEIDMVCSKFKEIPSPAFCEPPVKILFCGKTRSGKSRLISCLLCGDRGKRNKLHLCLCPDRGNDSFTNCIWRVRKGPKDSPKSLYRFVLVGQVVLLNPMDNHKMKIHERKELKIVKIVYSYINVLYDKDKKGVKVTKDIYQAESTEGGFVLKMDLESSKPGIVSEYIAFALRGEKYERKGGKETYEKIVNFISKIKDIYDQKNENRHFALSEIIVEHPLEDFQNYEFIDCAGSGELEKYHEIMKREIESSHFVVYVTNVSVSTGLGIGVLDELTQFKASFDAGKMSEKLVLVGTHIDKKLGDVPNMTDDDEEEEGEEMDDDEVNEKLNKLKKSLTHGLKSRKVEVPVFLCCSVKNRSQLYGRIYEERFDMIKNYMKERFEYLMFTLPCNVFLNSVYEEIYNCCKVLTTDLEVLMLNQERELNRLREICKMCKLEMRDFTNQLKKFLKNEKVTSAIKEFVVEDEIDEKQLENCSDDFDKEMDATNIICSRIISAVEIYADPMFEKAKMRMMDLSDDFDINTWFGGLGAVDGQLDLSVYDYLVFIIQNLGLVKGLVQLFFSNIRWKDLVKGEYRFSPTKEWRLKEFLKVYPIFAKALPGSFDSLSVKVFDRIFAKLMISQFSRENVKEDKSKGKGIFNSIIELETRLLIEENKFMKVDSLVFKQDNVSLIGRGTYGNVYRGCFGKSHCAVKIEKTFHPLVFKEIHYMNVVKRMGDKKNFSNLMPLLTLEKREGKHLIVMPLVPSNLRQVIRNIRKRSLTMTDQRKLKFIIKIAQGMKFLHYKGIFHRDLKPENIMIDMDKEKVFITDFGFTKNEKLSSNTVEVGTTVYKDPRLNFELKLKYGLKCDIYSLGLIFAEFWEGKIIVEVLEDEVWALYENRDGIESNQKRLKKILKRTKLADVKILKDLTVEGKVSGDMNELVKNCVCLDEVKRYDINQVIEHLNRIEMKI